MAALHRDARGRHVGGEPDRVVRLGEDRLGHVRADLLRVHVERGDDLDVADVVAAQIHVHQPGHAVVRVRVLVVLESLHERRGAVPHAHDRQTDLAHEARSFLRSAEVTTLRSPFSGGAIAAVTFGLDQALEPRDVGFGGVAPVLHQRERVVVDPLARGAERVLDGGQTVLQERAPPFEQADPRLRGQVLEEREAHAEARVLGGVVVRRLLQQLEEELLALLGHAVDVLASSAPFLVARDALDGALLLQAAERRVERAVGDPPEAAQRLAELPGELVAVHGLLLQQAEYREFQHAVCRTLRSSLGWSARLDVSTAYIRFDISNRDVGPSSTWGGVRGCGRSTTRTSWTTSTSSRTKSTSCSRRNPAARPPRPTRNG